MTQLYIRNGFSQFQTFKECKCHKFFRSLGCFPTEGELNDMIAEVEEDEPTGYVRYERFEPMMTRVLMDKSRYRPEPEDRFVYVFVCLYSV